MATQSNSVTVSAVPFNPQTQTFGSAPAASNQYSMGTVNLNQAPVNPITPAVVPKTQSISTLNTQPIQLPQQTQNQQSTVSSNYPASYLSSQQTAQQQQDQQVVDYSNNLYKTLANVIPQLSGQTEENLNQQKTLGVPQMNQNLQDLSNQILQRNAELNQSDVSLAQGLQSIQDQAIPMQFITGQQASVQNQAQLARAVKVSNINMLNAVAQSVQGNIALAQQTAQQAVDLKYAPIKDMYNTLIAQQQAIQPLLTSAEKRISDSQTAQYELQKTLATQKQAQESKFLDLVLKAPTDYGSTPEQVNSAVQTYQKTGDVLKAAQALTGTGASALTDIYNTQNDVRNTTYNGIGQLTIDNGYDLNSFKQGIAGVESGSNYNAIGPATKSGDKAYGKYQVMGANISSWTKQALGYSMTPDQFLKSPDAQEKVFENQSLTNYAKYGNWDDVASVWFSGRPLASNTSSDGYNTVPQYVSKVRANMGVPTQPTTLSTVTNPTVVTWAKAVQTGSSDIKDVPKNLQTQVLAYNQQNVDNTPKVQAIVEKVNNIDNILSNPTLSSVVGPNFFTRGVVTPILTGGLVGYALSPQFSGKASGFIGDVQLLTSQETIDNLIKAKASGATFGALSDSEQALLRNAATKINNWAIKDGDGNVTGYNTSEENFKTELNRLKTLAQKGIAQAGGNILGGTVADVYLNSVTQPLLNSSTPVSAYASQFTR